MIIWGSKGRTKSLGRGNFYCPRCGTKREYNHKSIGKYFTLYFIPLFKTSDLAEYIECTFCLTPFEPAILQHSGQNQQAVREFLDFVRDEIESGRPLQYIYNGLLSSGASEEAANTVIATATGGNMKQCAECKMVYSGSLDFCSNCGEELSAIQ